MEQQKAKRNLILAILLAIVIGVVFLFVAVPLIFQFAIDYARRKESGIVFTDTIPPQKPAFQPPEKFLKSKELQLSGYTEAGAQVELVLNGQSYATTTADEEGEFTFTENLDEGDYNLIVNAADEAGNVNTSAEYQVTVDVTTPTLEIEKPENDQVFTLRSEKVVQIAGKLSEQGRVYVNGSLVNTDEEGAFTTSLALGEGENTLKFRGEDQAGNATEEQEIKVRYEP